MAFDSFLKIEGIDGESTDAVHKDEIELLSYSFGVTQSGSFGGGGGGGTGKASFQDFHFVSRLQKSSPKLFLACAAGEHIKSATLSVRRTDNKSPDFYKVTLSDIIVSSFQHGGSGSEESDIPSEQVSLNYAKIKVDYSVQDAKGALGENVSAEWDLRENREG